jgi:hypothetical protein
MCYSLNIAKRLQREREKMLIDITLPLVGTLTIWAAWLVLLTIGLPMLLSICLAVWLDTRPEKAGNK